MARRKILTSESVTEGHPDKMMDQISDAVLDAALKQDPYSRVAIESVAKTGFVLLAGELTTNAQIDFQKVVRETVKEIGYTHSNVGFDAETCAVMLSISQQSPDIHLGVKNLQDGEVGAGDQGLMFGYATNETPELMPLPIVLAHKLTKRLSEVRKNKALPYLGPDGKSQVSVEYVDEKPTRVTTIVVSSQHDADIPLDQLRADIKEQVIPVCKDWIDDQTVFHINPTGRFVLGGPAADAGLTGRKIIVDTYGGLAPHGGGAFSGKDPTKVDRSAAYLARYIAKNIVAAGLADRCEVQLAYAIGVAEPVSVAVNTFNTHKIDEQAIEGLVRKHFALTPRGIIRHLDLLRPIYKKTAAYGHFGRNDPDFTWEKTDKAEELKQAALQLQVS